MNQQEQIYLQAGEWIDRLSDGTLEPSAQTELEKWLSADRAHRVALESMLATWADPALDKAFRQFHKASRENSIWQSVLASKKIISGMAAVLVLCILFAFLASPKDVSPPLVVKQEQQTLSDGSEIRLQRSSELIVDFSDNVRRLHLKKGQGYFDVAKDKTRPFVVNIGTSSVTAVGTAFNIDKGNNRIDVEVYEGVVKVTASEDRPSIRLKAGEKVSIRNSQIGTIDKFKPTQIIDWRTGWIELSDEPLSFLLERMNRYSHKNIVLVSPDLGRERVAGRFQLEDTQQTLKLLVELYQLSVENTPRRIEVRRQHD